MKKLLLVMAVVAFCFTANAQETTFGLKAGVNFASVGGDDADGLDSRTSFHFGGVATIGISEKFAVQPELQYSSQGASEGDADLKLDYLNVPVLAKITVAEGFSVEVGPQIGFLLSADADGEDVKEFLKSTDFSAAIGMNYQLESGLNFGARYNLGLGNVVDEEDADWKNNVFQVSIGFNFL
ncbi:PorT family protein [Flavobacteriaceae bacterium S0825]|uniref:porin family protein n=1 Tax=Gaetbulibacter sp. S0825 TaxID=2720084 RepID=UPI00142FECFA|nr:porin family protein [Gaetbulibacter sp. S0825]MCK0109876.1 PorT family protein [Flavobacteriaceae bacterium S0825]NIX65505.1 PorT family protein [Gaetbulibacter sp. S0825]